MSIFNLTEIKLVGLVPRIEGDILRKVILITGTSRGLGEAMFNYLSTNNSFKVYGTSRNPIGDQLIQLDITDSDSIKNCILQIIEKEGRIDVLINNVGSNLIGSLEGTLIKNFQEEMDCNFFGAVRMIQEVMPYFRKNGYGRIINISSIGSKVSLPFNSSYSASKAALNMMSESFAYELEGLDIHISVIMPIGLTIDEVPNIKYIQNEKEWNRDSARFYHKMRSRVTPSVSKIHVAKKVEKVINVKRPKLWYTVGLGSRLILLLHQILNPVIFSKLLK